MRPFNGKVSGRQTWYPLNFYNFEIFFIFTIQEEKALPIFDKIPPQLQIRPSVITVTQLNIHREITANFTEGIGGLRKWVDAARGGGRNVRTQSEKKRRQQKQKGQPHNRKFSKVVY